MSSKIDFTENVTADVPGTPSAGKISLYAKDDGDLYAKNSAGTETNISAGGGGGGAPTDATYILQVADGDLANAQALGALGTGLLKNTTSTGVLSIAAASDVPDLPASKITSGELPVERGGTGVATLADGGLLRGAGTSDVEVVSGSNDGDTVYWDGTDFVSILSPTFLLASGTLGSDQASISLASIPGTWKNLRLILNLRSTHASDFQEVLLQVNGDTTAANYYTQVIGGASTTIFGARNLGAVASLIDGIGFPAATSPANSFSPVIIDFLDYRNTSRHKTIAAVAGTRYAAAAIIAYSATGVWVSTSAITSIQISMSAGDVAAGSTYSLYGTS